ncbi:MAG: ABC transporter ATP-binding protein [Lachnospiraceae bacterium]|nr:ABC transporter ATP-binding protein [Lachnospiraceae bacterium]
MSEIVLQVEHLTKEYPSFLLDDVSFSVEKGSIMGFIGRNGAGKTTTMKSILNLIHKKSGEIRFFGLDLSEHEKEIKERIGYAGGAVDYYRRKKIRDLVSVTKRFYENWDDTACRKYMKAFDLSEEKTPGELSEGMKVKLNLTLALSHRAELLILDEPTSGLDPISRDELLDIFTALRDKGVSVFFSTHITSDLDKCADHITYIKDGKILATDSMAHYLSDCREKRIGTNLEEIMLHYEKEDFREKLAD